MLDPRLALKMQQVEAALAALGLRPRPRWKALGKIAVVIYANHTVRAAAQAMREVFAAIRHDGGIHQIDQRIASVEDIFDLQRVAAMKAAEKRYLR